MKFLKNMLLTADQYAVVSYFFLLYLTKFSKQFKMSGKKHKFKSQEAKVTCHVCRKVMLKQNFSTHMKDIHGSNETMDASQMSIAAMFKSEISEKRPRLEQETSTDIIDINAEGEEQELFASFSFQDRHDDTLELVESQKDNIVSRESESYDNCNNQWQCSESDMSESKRIITIGVETVKTSAAIAHDPQSSSTVSAPSSSHCELSNLKTEVTHLKDAVEHLRGQVAELQKLKLSNTGTFQPEEDTTSMSEYDDDDSLLKKCKNVEDIMTHFPELELVREDLQ